eukprot:8696211-Pyramimonas_sp.AAC.1
MMFREVLQGEVVRRFSEIGVDATAFGVERNVTTLGVAVGHGAREVAWEAASCKVRSRGQE